VISDESRHDVVIDIMHYPVSCDDPIAPSSSKKP
jgi:hypothetical protein